MMSQSLFLAAADAGPVTQIAHTFGANWPALISNIISFTIVALLLKKFAFKPIQQVLQERTQRIEKGLSDAARIKSELAAAETKAREIVLQASEQCNRMIEEARAPLAAETERTRQQAVADAQDILEKARQASEAELRRMKAELRKEMTRLIVETSGKVTSNVLTVDQKQRLADETNQLLANN